MVAHCAAKGKAKTLMRAIRNIDHAMMEAGDGTLPMPDNADHKRPTIDERLEAVAQSLELVAAMHLDDDREFRTRFAEIAKAQAQDGEHIRALVRIAEIHERRLSHLEGEQQ
jgi:hypothetical protein